MICSLLHNDTEFINSWDEDLRTLNRQTKEIADEYYRMVYEKLCLLLDKSLLSVGFNYRNPDDFEFLRNNCYLNITYDGRLLCFLDHPELGRLKIVWMERLNPPLIGLEIKAVWRL